MKSSINIKGASKLGVAVALSIWLGYAAGYHRRVRGEQREWWASVRFDSQGNRVFDGPQARLEFDASGVRQNPIPDKLER